MARIHKSYVLVAVAFVVVVAVFLLNRSSPEGPQSDFASLPVNGDSGFYETEEAGVFEDAAADDVVTMDAPDSSAQQHATSRRHEAARAALPRYHAALVENPYHPLLLNNYAWALHLAGRYTDAEEKLRQVIQIAPDRAIAYANLGETLWKQGKNEEAAAMYRQFLAMNTNPRRDSIASQKVAQITGVSVSTER